MSTTATSFLTEERTQIETIRSENPTAGQMTLAKQIAAGEFDLRFEDLSLRPLLSIYSVIRRYDARNS